MKIKFPIKTIITLPKQQPNNVTTTFNVSVLAQYLQYPVVFAPDIGVGIMDIIFGNSNRMEIMGNMVDDAIVNEVTVSDILIGGSQNYLIDLKPDFAEDFWNFGEDNFT